VVLPFALHSSAHLTQATPFALRLKSFMRDLNDQVVQIWNRFPCSPLVTSEAPWRRKKPGGGWTVTLLKWALLFFVISIIAGILGFTGISAASADVARILFYIFLVIFLVLLILGLTIFRV